MQKQRPTIKVYAKAKLQLQCSKNCIHLQAVLAAPALEASTGETGGECASRGLYDQEFFPGVGKIAYEGNESTNPLAFHYYNAEEVIMGKPMKEWFAPCWQRVWPFTGKCRQLCTFVLKFRPCM